MSTSLKMAEFKTELGSLTAIGDEKALYLLEFVDCPGLDWEIKRLKEKTGLELISGVTEPIDSIQKELSQYFAARLQKFTTPLCIFGSPFQKRVWEELRKIPYGKTTSYGSIATTMGRPKAYRAVAQANGANQFVIVIPCHRVINTNGELGGYSSGMDRKKWLLNHEKKLYQ